ncbi:AEC family transporter [Anaerosinus massiliensis]|uniref:AEC family transporter n=1 Tax=Massilibacillus massiliensis TaxID=1806837 RepID=UPI000DA62619|nr:transporter [Massilibacillus massiliensis]
MRILYVLTDLILPLLVGYYLQKGNWMRDELCNKLISFNIVVICTILSILSFWVLPLNFELVWLPFFGIILCVIPGVIGYFFGGRQYENPLERGSYLSSAILSNIGTLGGLCAFILYGEIGFAYAQMVGIFQNLVLVLFCFPLAQYFYQGHESSAKKKKIKFSLRQMFLSWNQLPVAGMIVGMFLSIYEVPRPIALSMFFDSLIHIGAWLALLPVGFLIDFKQAKKYYLSIWKLLPIKFIATPFITYFMIRFLFTDQVLIGTIMVLAVTPTAINAVVTAKLFKLNVDLSIAAFILTTAIYLLFVFPGLFLYIKTGNLF